MSKVEFDEFQTQSYTNFGYTSKVVNWVIKYSGGLIKNEKQAQYVLLGFVILSFIISGFLTLGNNSNLVGEDVIILPAEF